MFMSDAKTYILARLYEYHNGPDAEKLQHNISPYEYVKLMMLSRLDSSHCAECCTEHEMRF